MDKKSCVLVGVPIDSGKRRRGCLMGPDAYRTAGIAEMASGMGYEVVDRGNLRPRPCRRRTPRAAASMRWPRPSAWTEALIPVARQAAAEGFPIFLGGDHALALGSVAGMAAHAAEQGRPLFVLWLDAHTDYHTPVTSSSGNLHGTPLGYVTGRVGFRGCSRRCRRTLPTSQVCLIGLRSVDAEEARRWTRSDMDAIDMRSIDEDGIAAPLRRLPGPGGGGERPASRLARCGFPRPLDRAGGRHHGAGRRDLPRGASGDGDAA